MMKPSDTEVLCRLLKSYGPVELTEQIARRSEALSNELTIVANAGLHPLPKEWIFGDLFVASEGNLNFSDANSVKSEIKIILEKLNLKLKEKRWNKIYLIPFGHSVISMNIKIAIYRALRIETTDLFYFGDGRYDVIDVDTRSIMLDRQ